MNFEPLITNNQPTFIAQGYISEQACNQVIAASKLLDEHPGTVAGGVKEETKLSYDISIPPNYVLKQYQTELDNLVEQYLTYFRLDEYGPPMRVVEHMNIQRYPVNGAFFKLHCDRGSVGSNRNRELVFMTYLNDVDIGGETEFVFQRLKVSPRLGKTIIWPAGWTHLHRGLPSSVQEKLIITGWISNVA